MTVPLDKIFIKDLSLQGIIGVDPWERVTPQEILINVVLYTDLTKAGSTDNLDDTINYSLVAKKIMQHVEIAQRLTVEALAADIANICLLEPGVSQVQIRVEKPNAVRLTRSVGVEIIRARHDPELG